MVRGIDQPGWTNEEAGPDQQAVTILRLNLNDGVFIILKDGLYVLGDSRKRFSGPGVIPVRKTSDQNYGEKECPARSSAHETITG